MPDTGGKRRTAGIYVACRDVTRAIIGDQIEDDTQRGAADCDGVEVAGNKRHEPGPDGSAGIRFHPEIQCELAADIQGWRPGNLHVIVDPVEIECLTDFAGSEG